MTSAKNETENAYRSRSRPNIPATTIAVRSRCLLGHQSPGVPHIHPQQVRAPQTRQCPSQMSGMRWPTCDDGIEAARAQPCACRVLEIAIGAATNVGALGVLFRARIAEVAGLTRLALASR
jgi:hypothetical protein